MIGESWCKSTSSLVLASRESLTTSTQLYAGFINVTGSAASTPGLPPSVRVTVHHIADSSTLYFFVSSSPSLPVNQSSSIPCTDQQCCFPSNIVHKSQPTTQIRNIPQQTPPYPPHVQQQTTVPSITLTARHPAKSTKRAMSL
ncbi:hypothetical protein Hypma_004197 [Hypsizygus marmoreus]|uniref:Uncharacterized protein n=1 Tax=Hypsizygus marmoreus TaxID=39966 RepID=A0A369J7G8_HYPMA|nr:hypothetical protein Hypma_004197 [Hypsizygus marmoreus]